MSRSRRALAWVRARPGTLAIVAVALSWAAVMHSMGWAQLGHYAEVRALADGRKDIDPWHWETGDVAYIDGHYYSVKSPGMAAVSTLPYLAIEALGGLDLAADAAANAAASTSPRWAPNPEPPYSQYGYDRERALEMEARIQDGTPVVWALTCLAAVLPATLLLFGVRRVAERLEPGYGTAAAVTLGLGTILAIFAAEFFSHAISTAIAFAAFMVLLHERAAPSRLGLVFTGGLLAGLAVTFEVQVGLVGVVLFLYAIAREDRVRRGAAYAAGAVAGALPHLLFNWWMLGSPFKLGYGDAVATIGFSGHDEIGLNDDGFFGITLPRLDAALDLLVGGRGLLVLTPVVALGAVGIYLMHRRGHRAEALTLAGIAGAYFLYNIAYWQPYGGGTPGPRFMTPALPFLALGLAYAYRRLPATTLALAVPSALWMLIGTLTFPLIGEQHGTGTWVDYLADGDLEHTVLSVLGVGSNWVAIVPILLAVAAAAALAAVATPRFADADPRDLRLAAGALGAWAVVSVVGPSIAQDSVTPLDGSTASLVWVGVGGLAALGALAWMAYRSRPGSPAPVSGELALGDRTS